MLVLKRRIGEEIVIGGLVVVRVVDIDDEGQVKLGIEAPREITVDRREVHDRRRQQK